MEQQAAAQQRHEEEMKQVWQLSEKQHADSMHMMIELIRAVSKKSKKSKGEAESSSTCDG